MLPMLLSFIFLCFMGTRADSSSIEFNETHQLPFVIHICSFNNKQWVEKNLDSVFMQKYENFRVVYVDDQSDDGTADAVRKYMENHQLEDRITLYANTVRCRKMKNMYSTMRLCDDNEIIVQVDGDDWLCDDQLLARLNHIYQTQDVWLTYGSYNDYPSGERGYCAETPLSWVEKKLFRKRKWLYMHPRSFYAWLFKAIKVSDHLAEKVKDYQGLFYPSADDQTSFWPMMEMAGKRFCYIPEITYICNRGNPLSGRIFENPLQKACGGDARQRPVYATLPGKCLDYENKFSVNKADIIVISSNNPRGASEALHSVEKYIAHGNQVTLLYYNNKLPKDVYSELRNLFPNVDFVQCKSSNMLDRLHSVLQKSTVDHILLLRDRIAISQEIDILTAIKDLETTRALGLYFAFAPDKEPFNSTDTIQGIIPFVHLYENVYAWKFSCGKYAFFNNIDTTLLRKKDLVDRCRGLQEIGSMQPSESFYTLWQNETTVDLHGIGLFYQLSPVEGKITTAFAPVELPRCIQNLRTGKNVMKATIKNSSSPKKK